MKRTPSLVLSVTMTLASVIAARPADAGCGCDKPPPARATVRPFVGYVDQDITIIDDALVAGRTYDVHFESLDGRADWSRARAKVDPDLADDVPRPHLRVAVGDVSLGPCRIAVWRQGTLVLELSDELFTVTARPIALHDFQETITREGYQAGVGRDGTVYISVDVGGVTQATTFTGETEGFPMRFGAADVVMYNSQGFLMQLLDPGTPGLFQITPASLTRSTGLSYWRHEFATYKEAHRRRTGLHRDGSDWHDDGSYHVDHDGIVVALRSSLPNGTRPAPGATPPFRLVVTSSPEPGVASMLQ